jgi:murein DD-endopeptidase MepM/ murein hydrolase activator NlpD
VRRIAIILGAAAALATAAPAVAAQDVPGAGAHAAAGGVSAPQPEGSGTSGGASYGTLQQLDAERDARRRKAERRAAAKRRALARKRAAAQRASARKRARKLAKAKARARARARRQARRRTPAPAPVTAPAPASDHVFPVAGAFSLGGKDSRFGAGRPGHVHQGQDILADSGTPIVAPWPGTVRFVKFQAGGAGYYVVLAGDGENRDYVFMHLLKGSTTVAPGDRVAKGQQFAAVGSTGSSSGPHLHFEIWVGGWYVKGGAPVDPLPILQSWL